MHWASLGEELSMELPSQRWSLICVCIVFVAVSPSENDRSVDFFYKKLWYILTKWACVARFEEAPLALIWNRLMVRVLPMFTRSFIYLYVFPNQESNRMHATACASSDCSIALLVTQYSKNTKWGLIYFCYYFLHQLSAIRIMLPATLIKEKTKTNNIWNKFPIPDVEEGSREEQLG